MKTYDHWLAPDASAVVCAVLSLYEVYWISGTLGSSCQYSARRATVTVCEVNDFTWYGPVPTGFGFV